MENTKKIFMVSHKNRGPATKAVEAESKEEAMEKFNAWRETLKNKENYSTALNAHELNILR